jgi:hypothetical protein
MKQKTIGLNPLEEYLSGKKQSKQQTAASVEDNPVQTEQSQAAVSAKTTKTEESVSLSSVSSVAEHVQARGSVLEKQAAEKEQVVLQEPLSIDSTLSGQLTIDDSVGRGQQLAGKQRITLHISAEIVDRVKNAVYWEPGLTVAGFAEDALEKALAEMETQRGAPFPQRRQHRLRGGRPII